jgi:DNA-directed RNA polymerase I, II, and III subunit RPABC3
MLLRHCGERLGGDASAAKLPARSNRFRTQAFFHHPSDFLLAVATLPTTSNPIASTHTKAPTHILSHSIANMADAQVFEESFTISNINNEKYDRVSRITGASADSSISMTLDINHELFPVTTGETLNLVLATTLALDGSAKGENDSMWRNVRKPGVTTLADMYDYVCYGKNYRMEGGDGETM